VKGGDRGADGRRDGVDEPRKNKGWEGCCLSEGLVEDVDGREAPGTDFLWIWVSKGILDIVGDRSLVAVALWATALRFDVFRDVQSVADCRLPTVETGRMEDDDERPSTISGSAMSVS
jgi:hypothetical protein